VASGREIRRRIRSIGSTAQITRAMQMVAASKMRKAQDAALQSRPFMQLLYRIQRAATHAAELQHPLLEVREVKKRAVILVGADKGLCGALNGNVLREAAGYDKDTTVFITAGRRAAQFVARTGRTLAAEFAYGDNPTFAEARAIAAFARDLFLERKVDEVVLVGTRFVNTLTQQAGAVEYLPVGEVKGLKVPGMEPDAPEPGESEETLFEPDAETVLSFLLGHYLNIFVYIALLNAKASEQSARMVSMKNATDAAEALIKDLSLDYNKLRQGSITQELLDISGGQSD
jgi:F-type H+-transporting ATPase subunit gamma